MKRNPSAFDHDYAKSPLTTDPIERADSLLERGLPWLFGAILGWIGHALAVCPSSSIAL